MQSPDADATQVLERILSSYGFTSKKQLSDKLEITSSNVSSWLQRNSIPGNVIIECALSTGASLEWLVTGKLTDARKINANKTQLSGSKLREQLLNASGGKALIRRIMDAYGFKKQTELGDYFQLSSGTISTWIRREFFPGEIVITCALDTGAPLHWLATGQPSSRPQEQQVPVTIETAGTAVTLNIAKYQLTAGQMKASGTVSTDPSMLPSSVSSPAFIFSGRYVWLADMDVSNIANGKWLIDLDGNIDIYNVSRLPGNKLQVKNETTDFQCSSDELKAIGLIATTTELHV
ncbi:phage repressor protein CI [Rahnella inusitata]|uniref:phage repressor protein CI n=1 Tax=Rahnella inusitata TaxID=58169 RepID=UPI0039BE749C